MRNSSLGHSAPTLSTSLVSIALFAGQFGQFVPLRLKISGINSYDEIFFDICYAPACIYTLFYWFVFLYSLL